MGMRVTVAKTAILNVRDRSCELSLFRVREPIPRCCHNRQSFCRRRWENRAFPVFFELLKALPKNISIFSKRMAEIAALSRSSQWRPDSRPVFTRQIQNEDVQNA